MGWSSSDTRDELYPRHNVLKLTTFTLGKAPLFGDCVSRGSDSWSHMDPQSRVSCSAAGADGYDELTSIGSWPLCPGVSQSAFHHNLTHVPVQ